MILKIFTIHDAKSEAYLTPIYFRTKGEAIRAFTATVNDETSNFSKNPEDFTLFELGEYDDCKAKLSPHLTAIPIGKALEFVKQSA